MTDRSENIFTQRLKAARRAKNLTQEALAEMLGATRTAVVFWETGRVFPRWRMLLDIAGALDVSVDWLVGGVDGSIVKEPAYRSTFAQRLSRARRAKGWSQWEFSEMMDVGNMTVAFWETDRRLPKIDRLVQMARLLEVSTDWLLGVSD